MIRPFRRERALDISPSLAERVVGCDGLWRGPAIAADNGAKVAADSGSALVGARAVGLRAWHHRALAGCRPVSFHWVHRKTLSPVICYGGKPK